MKGSELSTRVYSLLRKASPEHADEFKNDFVSSSTDVMDMIADLNRHFEEVLLSIPSNTSNVRELLVDNIQPLDWIDNFEAHVLPILIRW